MSLSDKSKRMQPQGDALEGNSLFCLQRPGEAPVVCLLQDAVQEGINAEGFGSLALLAESRWKRGFIINVRFNKMGKSLLWEV